MRLILALTAALCLSFASGTRAAPRSVLAATPTVTITQSGPVPVSRVVGLGTTVRWLNTTARTHRVTADRGTFPSFLLAAGASHTYRFGRAGRYPYKVDNRLRGTIVVVAGGTPPGSSAGTGGSASCKALCDVHYAVSIKGMRTYKDTSSQTTPPGTANTSGRTEITLEWTGQIPDAKVTVIAGRKVQIVGGGKGTAQAIVRFLESRPLWGGPCQGTASARIPIELALSVGLGKPFFDLTVEEHGRGGDYDFYGTVVDPAMKKACPGGTIVPGGPSSPGPHNTSLSLSDVPGPFGTVWFVATSSYLRIGIERASGTMTEAPFNLIRTGKPFTLERRLFTRTGQGCGLDNCSTVDIMEYTLTFTPIHHG